MRKPQPPGSQTVILTDLDGTFLDSKTYSYEAALPAVELIKKKGIPLVFCSSKTRQEQQVYRRELAIRAPFIVEDGGGIFIPRDYFPFSYDHDRKVNDCDVIELGLSYSAIREALAAVARDTELKLRGYGDMSVEQVTEKTGLDTAGARRAKQREYEETLVMEFSPEEYRRVSEALQSRGLRITRGGKWYGVSGSNDKGRAVSILIDLFRKQYGAVWTVGLGDSQNDVSLLTTVDRPILVQKPGKEWEPMEIPGLYRVEGVGPAGFNRAVLSLLSTPPN